MFPSEKIFSSSEVCLHLIKADCYKVTRITHITPRKPQLNLLKNTNRCVWPEVLGMVHPKADWTAGPGTALRSKKSKVKLAEWLWPWYAARVSLLHNYSTALKDMRSFSLLLLREIIPIKKKNQFLLSISNYYLFIHDEVKVRKIDLVALWLGHSYFSDVSDGAASPSSSVTCN